MNSVTRRFAFIPLFLLSAGLSAAGPLFVKSVNQSTVNVGDVITFSMDLDLTQFSNRPVDIYWVIDMTGSMGPHIQKVVDQIGNFDSMLAARGIDFRSGLLTFRDTTSGNVDPPPCGPMDDFGFYPNTSSFEAKLSTLPPKACGGGDTPESGLEALLNVSLQGGSIWRPCALRRAILVTDANLKDGGGQFTAYLNQFLNLSITTHSITFVDPSPLPAGQVSGVGAAAFTGAPPNQGRWIDINNLDYTPFFSAVADDMATLNNISIVDTLPPQLSFVPSGAVCGAIGNVVTCNFSKLGFGHLNWSFQAAVTQQFSGCIQNQMSFISSCTLPSSGVSNLVDICFVTPTMTSTPTISPTPAGTPLPCRLPTCTTNWTIVGNGTQISSGVRLTDDAFFQKAAAWSDFRLDLSQSWTIQYDFYLGDKENGADGIAFVMHDDPRGLSALGLDGAGLGYGDAPPIIGVKPSLAIEFDTYRNTGDPAEDHSSINLNGNFASAVMGPVQTSASSNNVEDDLVHRVSISWDASTFTIRMYFDGQLRLTYANNLVANIFGGNSCVYWGFTGSTGDRANRQEVMEVECFSPTTTPSPTRTRTPTNIPTWTRTPTVSFSPSSTRTWTRTASDTSTPTGTSTWTLTLTLTPTPSGTPTVTLTSTETSTVTPTNTGSPSSTLTWTPTSTDTGTSTNSPSPTPTFTCGITTISSDITGITSANACTINNQFYASDSNGRILLVTGGSPNFTAPGFNTQVAYNPSSTNTIHEIDSSCCAGQPHAWAVGDRKTLLVNEGGPSQPWVPITSTSPDDLASLVPPNSDLLGVDVDGCDVYIVGFNGLFMHRLGGMGSPSTGWTLVNPPTSNGIQTLLTVRKVPSANTGCTADWLVAAGKNASVYLALTSNPASAGDFITQLLPGTISPSVQFNDIEVLTDGSIYVIGTQGTVLRGVPNCGNGNIDWTHIDIGTSADLNDISASSPTDIIVVGGDSTVGRFDGTQWTVSSGGINGDILAVLDYFGFKVFFCKCKQIIEILCPTPIVPTRSPTPTTTPTLTFSPVLVVTPTPSPTSTETPTPTPPLLPTSFPSATFSETPFTATPSPTTSAISIPGSVTPGTGTGCCGNPVHGDDFFEGPTLVGDGLIHGDSYIRKIIGDSGDVYSNFITPPGGPGEAINDMCCTRCNGEISIWAVGNNGRVWHFYGGQWIQVTVPTTEDLNTVTCVLGDEVWIGGNAGTVLRGVGVRGSCTNFDFGGSAQPAPNLGMDIFDVKLNFSQTAVFVVGVQSGTNIGLAYYANLDSNGNVPSTASWTPITLPPGAGKINKIIQSSSTEFWVVGNNGGIYYSSGVFPPVFTALASGLPVSVQVGAPGALASIPLSSIDFNDVVAVTPSEIFVAGSDGVVLKLSGGTWTQILIGMTTSDFLGISASGPDQAIFVGDNGTVITYSGANAFLLNLGLNHGRIIGICENMICIDICASPCTGHFELLPETAVTEQGFVLTPMGELFEDIFGQVDIQAVLQDAFDPAYTGRVTIATRSHLINA